MKTRGLISCSLILWASVASGAEDFFDRVDDDLTVAAFQDNVRARLSGTLDLEGYHFQQPAPGLIYADGNNLFNPRLTVFLDAQLGPHLYVFAQARADRGFDPSDDGPRVRLDEYALRFTPWDDARFNLQIGKFSTSVGNWVQRHGSWDNPFVTAPLPYENLTGIWNVQAAHSSGQLLAWAHVKPSALHNTEYAEKPLRTPLIWGPDYTTGAAVFGAAGKIDYALELKNASLSAHPGTWDGGRDEWRHPSFSGRVGYRPDASWNLGLSFSEGPYLRPSAAPTLAPGYGLGDYREIVVGQDIGFAWHHWQVWTELYHARFEIPTVANADTVAYYAEVKYRFTPQFSGALRWNQQLFATIPDGKGGRTPWGRDAWRLDFAPAYRFTPHTQLKLQYSLQHDDNGPRDYGETLSMQFTVRF